MTLALFVMLALGAPGGSFSGSHAAPPQYLFVTAPTPPTYAEDQHWGGFDAPTNTSVEVLQLMWIQQSPSLLGGTLVFELRHSNGTLLCSGSTTCDVAAGTDVRAACSATLEAGAHANLMVGASSTCTTLPGGMLVVSAVIQ